MVHSQEWENPGYPEEGRCLELMGVPDLSQFLVSCFLGRERAGH